MNSQAPKPSKPSKPSNPSSSTTTTTLAQSSSTSRPSSSLSSHLAMVELKQRILTSIAKLSDRDTHQIAVEDLENIIQTLSSEGISMILNCLYDASSDPKPAVKRESLRLLALLCTSHSDSTSTHLTKIISHIVKRLKDSDSSVRESCRDTIGALSSQYLKGEGDNGNLGSVVSLFVKPLFEAMNEQNKVVQAGSAMCMARMIECASDKPVAAFQKLCPRICKNLNNPNFLAKASLLLVVSSLSQVGSIAPQNLPTLLQSIHECLESSDWATRKAAADTLSALASHSSHLVTNGASSTISTLEACRFDKVKPVRDSMTEALQLWKKIAEKECDGTTVDPNASSCDGKSSQSTLSAEKSDPKKTNPGDKKSESANDASNVSSTTSDSLSKAKGSSISDKTAGILKKRAPALTDKELNPEFFQKLETRGSGDLPVEVVVPRRFHCSSNSQVNIESEPNDQDYRRRSNHNGNIEFVDGHRSANVKLRCIERGSAEVFNKRQYQDDAKSRAYSVDDRVEITRGSSSSRVGIPKTDGHVEGSIMNNKGNWLAIQRQLSQLERQQAHLMDMLQDFMGGSHDSMVTLENRVRGLERVVEDMARDLATSSGRRGSNFMAGFDGSSSRALSKYNGFSDYSSTKLGRGGGDGRVPFAERFLSSDGIVSGARGRDHPWRSDASETWDSYSYGALRNGHTGSRRALGGAPNDDRSPRSENDGDQVSNRRGWDKGPGNIRLGEGPSARSVWQASKDEATLEAIRGISRSTARVAIPELTAEALGDDNGGQDRDPIWASWTNAMDALQTGDMDMAFSEVLSTGDDLLLVKLMDRSGPVMDQLSNETVTEVLHVLGHLLLEQKLFDIGFSWIQQLVEIVMENGPNVFGIPMESKKEILLNLHEASIAFDTPEDWEGGTPDQLMSQLASTWGIDLQQFEK